MVVCYREELLDFVLNSKGDWEQWLQWHKKLVFIFNLTTTKNDLLINFFYFIKGLMPNFAPANSKKDPKTRYQWKKYNKYFDEDTIRAY